MVTIGLWLIAAVALIFALIQFAGGAIISGVLLVALALICVGLTGRF